MSERRAQPSPEPNTLSLTTAVEAIVEKTAKNGRTYQAIEYVDPNGELKNVAVWDKKLLTDVEKGHVVELTLARKGASTSPRPSPRPSPSPTRSQLMPQPPDRQRSVRLYLPATAASSPPTPSPTP
jgi:hypothetical protein